MPLVSVIMPVYNAEQYIRESIDSILNQTFKDFEFIIINDGSSDRTKEIIQSYNDPRIKYFENEKNLGIVYTLNRGIQIATGKYIARMDADDIAAESRLKKQVSYLDNNPKIGVVGSQLLVFGDNIKTSLFPYSCTPDMAKADLLFNSSLAHPTVMIRKSILDKYQIQYEQFYQGLEDYVMWWRVAQHAEIVSINEPLLKYRKHDEQITQQRSMEFIEKFKQFTFERLSIFNEGDEYEKNLFYKYCDGEYDQFKEHEFLDLLNYYEKLIKKNLNQKFFDDYSLKKVFGLSLSYILQHMNISQRKRFELLLKVFRKHVIPFILYIKILVHWILGR